MSIATSNRFAAVESNPRGLPFDPRGGRDESEGVRVSRGVECVGTCETAALLEQLPMCDRAISASTRSGEPDNCSNERVPSSRPYLLECAVPRVKAPLPSNHEEEWPRIPQCSFTCRAHRSTGSRRFATSRVVVAATGEWFRGRRNSLSRIRFVVVRSFQKSSRRQPTSKSIENTKAPLLNRQSSL